MKVLENPQIKETLERAGRELLLLQASDISKTYGAVVALHNASLAVRPGEVHALMGANGAGKSTLVKILAGVHQPDAGSSSNERQVGINVNLILRWEGRTGSTFYLVYAHQSSNDVKTGVVGGPSIRRELGALSAKGVAHGDSILVKVDLLSAL